VVDLLKDYLQIGDRDEPRAVGSANVDDGRI
jgi:hypothetical protein